MPDDASRQHRARDVWTERNAASTIAGRMKTDDLDFHLPPELIAQTPTVTRSKSRLLRYRRDEQSIDDRIFEQLPGLLRAGDVMVFNDARVIPARFVLKKQTGGRVEGLFLHERAPGAWTVLLKNVGPTPLGTTLYFADAPEVAVKLVRRGDEGECDLEVSGSEPATQVLQRVGRMPLPPYIRREKDGDKRDDIDRERYQTVYARSTEARSVAAPTAGLHFTPEVLQQIDACGVQRVFVTLHVGMGTFKPVTVDTLDAHTMHLEDYSISSETAVALNRAKTEGRRIIAVGTTACRVLESQPAGASFTPRHDDTDIFIRPPYAWRHVGALVTNFHLPRSTLIALVVACVGLDAQRRIYAHAIAQQYRFFSYGDAMFVE